jgi:hypothetical protein
MAGSSAVEAGKSYVTVFADDSRLVQGLRRSEQRVARFSAKVARAGAGLLGFGAGLSAPLLAAVEASSALTETMNKFDVVFGDRRLEVKGWGDDFADTVGRSKQVVADFLGSSQDLFVPIGFDANAAEEMSKQVTGLAVDLASFNNKADADTLRDLHAALTGSGEVMKKYGVIVSEAAVKQELLNQSIDPATATDQQKVGARWNIILRGTTAAQGDAIRSAGAYANQKKRLTATIKDAAAAVGGALEPALAGFVSKAADAIKLTEKWANANPEIITGVASLAAGAVGAGAGLLAIAAAGKVAAIGLGVGISAISTIGAVVGFIASPVGLAVAAIVGLGYAAERYFGLGSAAIDALTPKWQQLKREAGDAVGGITDALYAGDVGAAADVLWAGLRLQWAKGSAALNEEWSAWKNTAITLTGQAFFGIASAVETGLLNTIEQALIWKSNFLDVADDTFTSFMSKWDRASGSLASIGISVAAYVDPTIDEASLQQSLAEELDGRDDVRNNNHDDRDDNRAETLDKAERELADARRRIRDEYDAAIAETQAGTEANQSNAVAAGRAAIDEARRQFDEATGAAAELRADAEAESDKAGKKDSDGTTPSSRVSGPPKSKTESVAGTFSSAAVAGLGSIQIEASNPADKAAAAVDNVGTKLDDQSSQWDRWGQSAARAAQTAAAGVAAAATVAGTPVEANTAPTPTPTSAETITEPAPVLPTQPLTPEVNADESPEPTKQPRSRREINIERRNERGIPRVRPKFDMSSADRFRAERQNLDDSRTQRPVRPRVDDGIGRAHAIADQSRSLDPGDRVNTNAGNVADITAFSDANRRFERSQGIDTRQKPEEFQPLPEPAEPFEGYNLDDPVEAPAERRDPDAPKRSRREVTIANRNERRANPEPAEPFDGYNLDDPVEAPAERRDPDAPKRTRREVAIERRDPEAPKRTRREVAIERRNERRSNPDSAPELPTLQQPAELVFSSPTLPELVQDVTPELAALNLNTSPTDTENAQLVQTIDTAPTTTGPESRAVAESSFPDNSRAFQSIIELLDAINKKTPEHNAAQTGGGIRFI